MDTLEYAIDRFRQGNAREAELACERRLAFAPHDVPTLSLLAEIHSATGRAHHAATSLSRIVELQPHDAAVWRRLGAALLGLDRAAEAATALRAAIRIEPRSPRAHNNLGRALMQLGESDAAIASYAAALELDPAYAVAHFNLAVAFDGQERLTDALASYDRALDTAPQLVPAWVGRGGVLAKLHRWDAALDSFERALALHPADATTLIYKASVLLSLERATECLAAADAALNLDASSSAAHNVRAGALRRLGRRAEALDALDRALALDPRHLDAWCNQATILHELGRFNEALASCRTAVELDPTSIQSRTRLLARLIPSVPESTLEIRRARDSFDQQLAPMMSDLRTQPLTEREALTLAQQQFFYLSYDEESNRPMLEAYRGRCAARLAEFGLNAVFTPTADRATHRLKVGFVSAHVHDHSVFNAILRGWVQQLDRERFELSLFSLGSQRDASTHTAIASVDHFDSGARGVADWARSIRERGLDALIYPEIGMHETTLALAGLRLARRQFAAWGHPETSGLPTIDGYMSGALFEPPNAQAHYSEKLVCLPNFGVYCQPYAPQERAIDLQSIGIRGDRPMFICPGVPFKYRPQDDWIFAEIARRLQRCELVFFEHEIAELSLKLQARIGAAFAVRGLDPQKFLRSIPWQPRAHFFSLMRQADVYLDTVGFSGFNTLMQAMECHLPSVTYEGRFMRGRLGAGILTRLKLPQFVARDARDYVDLAVKLGEDVGFRTDTRDSIRRAEHLLYADKETVTALGNHLLAACSA
jgi:predicted O-linked N-acetylglucosamine transferase (SPINDLY family)